MGHRTLVFTGLLSLFVGCASRNGGDAGTVQQDGSVGQPDGAGEPGTDSSIAGDAAVSPSGDGAPMRKACTKQLANKLGASFGRLDGYLTAVIAPASQGCFSDADHVHLQVETADGRYDIAVNVNDTQGPDVQFKTLDVTLPGGAWSEGWHNGDSLDYAKLGVHATDFTAMPAQQLADRVASELATANHVSVFATPYSDGTGGHDVHRKTGGNDGALVVRPTDATAHLLLFHFASQSF